MKVLFAGGGTGGHIIPARNLAEWILADSEAHEARFLIAGRPVEDLFFENSRWLRKPLFPRGGARPSLMHLMAWGRAIMLARKEIRAFQPDALILAGGYASLPALVAWMGCNGPLYLLEQNACPGKVTRLASRFARRIFCHFESAVRALNARALALGSPLSPGFIQDPLPRVQVLQELGLAPDTTTLLVAGGSLGASAVNDFLLDNLAVLAGLEPGKVQVLHVAGTRDVERVSRGYAGFPHPYKVLPFIDPMVRAYRVADLIICRGGGMTLAEITALGLPAVVLPYPHHRDRHQYYNALEMREGGGALILEEKDANAEQFQHCVVSLLVDRRRLETMQACARQTGKPDSGEKILEYLKFDRRNGKV